MASAGGGMCGDVSSITEKEYHEARTELHWLAKLVKRSSEQIESERHSREAKAAASERKMKSRARTMERAFAAAPQKDETVFVVDPTGETVAFDMTPDAKRGLLSNVWAAAKRAFASNALPAAAALGALATLAVTATIPGTGTSAVGGVIEAASITLHTCASAATEVGKAATEPGILSNVVSNVVDVLGDAVSIVLSLPQVIPYSASDVTHIKKIVGKWFERKHPELTGQVPAAVDAFIFSQSTTAGRRQAEELARVAEEATAHAAGFCETLFVNTVKRLEHVDTITVESLSDLANNALDQVSDVLDIISIRSGSSAHTHLTEVSIAASINQMRGAGNVGPDTEVSREEAIAAILLSLTQAEAEEEYSVPHEVGGPFEVLSQLTPEQSPPASPMSKRQRRNTPELPSSQDLLGGSKKTKKSRTSKRSNQTLRKKSKRTRTKKSKKSTHNKSK